MNELERRMNDFLEIMEYALDWDKITRKIGLDSKLIHLWKHRLNWKIISSSYELSEKFITQYSKYVSWKDISQYQKLSLDFIKKNEDKINFEELSYNKHLTLDIIDYYFDKLDIIVVMRTLSLTSNIEFVMKYKHDFRIDVWDRLSFINIKDIDFIKQFKIYLNWIAISKTHRLFDDAFLTEFKDYMKWDLYILYQSNENRVKHLKKLYKKLFNKKINLPNQL